jgi:uncharacterized protein (DUF2252 family)
MADYPALVDAFLRPELAALAAVDPEAARKRVKGMCEDSLSFYRGALDLCAGWMARKAGFEGTWVWSAGDAHHRNFATLAVGRADAEGIVPVTFDVSDVDDEQPAPWRWDFVRLFASVALSKPGQKGSDFAAVVQASLETYARALEDGGEARVDLADLPEPLKELIDRDSGPEPHRRYIAERVEGEGEQARLRTGAELSRDLSSRAFFVPALTALYGDEARLSVTDVARRPIGGLSSLGRRRWLVCARERQGTRTVRLRLLEIKERPAGGLSRLVQVTPFAPAPGAAVRLTVAMGGDPFQRVLHGPAGSYLVRTRCHARRTIDPVELDAQDLVRLARLWGTLLANFHLRGLRALRADVPARANDLASEAPQARKDIARLAWEHAAFAEKAYSAFRKLARQWQG